MVKSAVKIELMTPDRVVVSTINKDISGNSSLDYSNATLAAGSSFSDEIKESGVFAYLGIKQ